MATIQKEIAIERSKEIVANAVRGVGAVHKRLVPGWQYETINIAHSSSSVMIERLSSQISYRNHGLRLETALQETRISETLDPGGKSLGWSTPAQLFDVAEQAGVGPERRQILK
jgi:hypothetical protein